jgi:hypothetical protein
MEISHAMSEWYFEALAVVIVLIVVGTGVIALVQSRRR